MKNNEVLRVEDLKKYFPIRQGLAGLFSSKKTRYVRAVDGVSFTVRKNENLGFVGESGCGKTTMGRVILRLTEPTSGKIYCEGIDITSLNKRELKEQRRRMQMIFQDPHGSLNPRRTVNEILRQSIRIHKLVDGKAEEDSLIKETLEDVGLAPADEFWNRYPILLSGGQRQRVGVARVLILRPKLVVADEPISMLDVSVRIGVLELLLAMRDEFGISLVYITHDLATARYICDRVAIMYLGKVVEIGPTEVIYSKPMHPYTKALIAAVPVPDPTVKMQKLPIKGYVPVTGADTGSTCNFYERCPYAMKKYMGEEPPLIEVEPDHYVACFKVK